MPRLLLHCTAKLPRELPADIIQRDAGGEPDEAWCLNLLRIGRKKCLLATHEATLYSVFIPEIRRADCGNLPALLLPALEQALRADGFCPIRVPELVTAIIMRADVNLRSVLHCMKEIAWECQLDLERHGGLMQRDARLHMKARSEGSPDLATLHFIADC